MKLFFHFNSAKGHRAFTLPEVMVTMATSVLVVSGVMLSHITGLKMCEIVKAKIGASDDTRDMMGRLVNEIRTAKTIRIGTATNSTKFTIVADNVLQQGNAIQIYPTADLTNCIQYYINTNQMKLIRSFNGANLRTMADAVTNKIAFASEDFSGNVLSDNENNNVISVKLNFYQLQYATGKSNTLAETYQVQTRIARRTVY